MESTQQAHGNFRPRRAWIAFVLGWLFPGLGHIYGVAPLRGVLALVAFWVVLVPAMLFVKVPLSFSPMAVIFGGVLSLAIALAVPIDSALTARRNRAHAPRRGNRVPVYVAYAVAVTLLSWPLSAWWTENFVFRTFKIPSGAMMDTLLVGDYIIADMRESKLFPLKRSDIIVFRMPEATEVLMSKRVIGLPGETVELRDGMLYVNGDEIPEPYVEPAYRDSDPHKNFGPVVVKDDHFFVLGDHRNASSDSRFWGQVPRGLMEGRVRSIWWSREEPATLPSSIQGRLKNWTQSIAGFKRTRWERIGRSLEAPHGGPPPER